MTTPGDDPRIGTEIAGFRIESLIGRGGMGVVYKAEQLRYGRRVALKILAPELVHDQSFRERFELEWQTVAKLEHPNIVPVYEAGEAEGALYIAMRYVDGIDLNALLAREGRLEPERAISIVGQVGSALDAAHLQGLVHRDVKPGNILVASGQGVEGEHVYLTDFGVAKQAKTRSGLTRTGLFVGTVDYAAPEQIEGKPLDGRTDVYALGCVLYQCLTGALPYEKDSEVAMLYAHLMEPAPSARAKRPELPPALDAAITKALAKPPDDRYDTCRDLVVDARRAVGLPTGARAPATTVSASPRTVIETAPGTVLEGTPPSSAPWWRSKVALVAAGLVLLAGVGAGVGIAVSGSGGEGSPPTTAAAPTTGPPTTGAPANGGDTNAGGSTGENGSETTPVDDRATAGALAFASQRDGDIDLYAMAPDGSGRVRLTNDPSVEGGPRWSPDGTKLAYYADADGDFDVYVLDLAGAAVTQLTNNGDEDLYPAWSPDGTKIAFTRRTGDADAEVFVMNADGSGEQQLTENEVEDRYPDFSPDGSQIVFATDEGGDYDIAVMNADGSGTRQLTDNGADDDAPAWSPDGSTIAFSSDRQDQNFDIWTMSAEGKSPRRLATASREDSLPRYSDDGSQIYFQSARDGDFEIFVMDADGTGQTQLTDDLTQDYEPDPSAAAALPAADDAATPFLTDAAAFPNEREAQLLAHVPIQTRPSCAREQRGERAGRAIAGVFCKSGRVEVFYDYFRTKDSMKGYYDRLVSGTSATRDSGGSCATEDYAEGPWRIGQVTEGRLLCYPGENGNRVFVWTYDGLRIVAFAQRPGTDKQALYRWWLGPKSGPVE
jgi:Protein kinase domain/WD40-like Beta Propeller Repeat